MAFSPRIAAIFDPSGDGRIKLQASYNQYVGRLGETIAGAGSPAGSPHFFAYYYDGPDIVGDSSTVIRGMLDWFFANGGTGDDKLIRDGEERDVDAKSIKEAKKLFLKHINQFNEIYGMPDQEESKR